MRHLVLGLVLGAGCASAPDVEQPQELPFAAAYLDRGVDRTRVAEERPKIAAREAPPKRTPSDETRDLLESSAARNDELRRAASNEAALGALLRGPLSRTDLETLAWLRAPAVAAARARLEAARTAYRQSADLADLVALYRSYLRETKTRVGPEKSRRPAASIAPYPNIDALSGELVDRRVAIAFEQLRLTIRDVVASAERAHADAARLYAARGVIRKDVDLHTSLVEVLRARLESGMSTQAALLAFQSRLEALRTELKILREEEAAVRARWNLLLDRPESAPVNLAVRPSLPEPDPSEIAPEPVVAVALEEQQALRSAKLAAQRQALAVRLAETMTLPRMDLGSSRFERERAGEAGVQRGAAFPRPGRMIRPRSEFGVREAQVAEMRSLHRAAVRAQAATGNATQAEARAGVFALDAARRRWLVRKTEIVPLAERSFDATRGSYEGNRAGYIELLDSARRLLRARLGLVDSRRDHSHARARLLEAVGVRTAIERKSK
jgi:outer membrane protein TolC